MNSRHVTAGRLDAGSVGERWVLVLGGVTRAGSRRAQRVAAAAVDSGNDVVWFDGLSDEDSDRDQQTPVGQGSPMTLLVVDFHEVEASSWAARLRSPSRFQANGATRLLWRVALRRVGSVLRPRACWTAIKSDIKRLSNASAPAAIVFCDDYSITSAWYSGKIWPDAPLTMELAVSIE